MYSSVGSRRMRMAASDRVPGGPVKRLSANPN
jgi:hypothetical protein